ncbi:MAG: hypothetical protein F6K40_10915 [Okeania sp. SIO3I5]|uniref:element excision factor XisH family protein n=1 Tax=Okeania sp. SIO3I5 TaxID=2607805 RepID=UPI0013B88E13|nr:element excision factor XisH family protein [Okeania sp. SIO3I5]NEQ36761.1 hypothetical protein [Okeania sp. SIO3I5]
MNSKNGQYLLYRAVLEEVKPDFLLYLAVRKITYQAIFSEPIGELVVNKYKVNILVCKSKKQEIWQWIS